MFLRLTPPTIRACDVRDQGHSEWRVCVSVVTYRLFLLFNGSLYPREKRLRKIGRPFTSLVAIGLDEIVRIFDGLFLVLHVQLHQFAIAFFKELAGNPDYWMLVLFGGSVWLGLYLLFEPPCFRFLQVLFAVGENKLANHRPSAARSETHVKVLRLNEPKPVLGGAETLVLNYSLSYGFICYQGQGF
jgi:hypothetical protein